MARYLGPKGKLSRREGTDLFLKSARRSLDPSASSTPSPASTAAPRARARPTSACSCARSRRSSRMYGVLERQFRRYFAEADAPQGQHRREPAAAARVAPGQRRLPHGLRLDARRSAPAGVAQRDHGQRQGRQHRRRTLVKAGDVVAVREKAKKQLRIAGRAAAGRAGRLARLGRRSTRRRWKARSRARPTAPSSAQDINEAWSSSCIRSNRQSDVRRLNVGRAATASPYRCNEPILKEHACKAMFC